MRQILQETKTPRQGYPEPRVCNGDVLKWLHEARQHGLWIDFDCGQVQSLPCASGKNFHLTEEDTPPHRGKISPSTWIKSLWGAWSGPLDSCLLNPIALLEPAPEGNCRASTASEVLARAPGVSPGLERSPSSGAPKAHPYQKMGFLTVIKVRGSQTRCQAISVDIHPKTEKKWNTSQ